MMNIYPCYGPITSATISEYMDIDKFAFMGSTEVVQRPVIKLLRRTGNIIQQVVAPA